MEWRFAIGRALQAILLVAAFTAMVVSAMVSPASADEKGAGTGLPAAATADWNPPSISKTTGDPVPPSACDWDYKQHPWPTSSDQRAFYARGGPYNHYYEAWLSHELQTAIDLNNVCASQIRTASDMTCYYRTTALGPRNLSSCGGYIYARLAIQNQDADYDRVEDAERYFYFHSNTGRPTLYSDWTHWTNDCWLPMIEIDQMDFHGDSWLLPGAANYYPIGCKAPYHPGV